MNQLQLSSILEKIFNWENAQSTFLDNFYLVSILGRRELNKLSLVVIGMLHYKILRISSHWRFSQIRVPISGVDNLFTYFYMTSFLFQFQISIFYLSFYQCQRWRTLWVSWSARQWCGRRMHSSLYKAGIIAQMFLPDNDDELKILLAW